MLPSCIDSSPPLTTSNFEDLPPMEGWGGGSPPCFQHLLETLTWLGPPQPNHQINHPTKSVGGKLLYIANYLCYKLHNDLSIYKKSELESTFAEIVNPEKSNIITDLN